MKNGPVISNISLINKAFSEIGSPLHYKLIVDYLRINWDLGRGIVEKEASRILDYALNAGFYYEEVEEQHFQRKQSYSNNLDGLYKELKQTKVPIRQNQKKPIYNIKDLYSDARFTIMVTENNDTYILLSEWNLLNDLALRLFIREQLTNIHLFQAAQKIKQHYQITDLNALFFPHFDHRFTVTKSGKVSLKSYDVSQIQTYSIDVTKYIREEVARFTPKLLSYLKERYGEEVKIRSLVNAVFGIEAHTPKFTAYFAAVKDHLQTFPTIRLPSNGDSFIYLENEEANLIEKVSLQGTTDNLSLGKKIGDISSGSVLLADPAVKSESVKHSQTRTSLTYTLRYYDRIQETLTAHYFRDWIIDHELHLDLLVETETIPLIFFYDVSTNVLHGTHLENMMGDYALIPGQKLHFHVNEENRLTLSLGSVKESDILEQERYIDIARLAEENKLTGKSVLQLVTETLIYHPSGLHLSEIIRLVKEDTPYAESSITSILSTQDYFEKVPGQSGFWVFNPAMWKRRKYESVRIPVTKNTAPDIKIDHKAQKIMTSHNYCKQMAKSARKNRSRLTNEMFLLMDKSDFLERAWTIYANNIYNFAKRYSSPEIPLEDYFQEAFFALVHAYDNYDPSFRGSFYNYFKRYLSTRFNRYQQDRRNLLRIPVHRMEVLERFDKDAALELLLTGYCHTPDDLENDYTVWKTNYISFVELYHYERDFEEVDDDTFRGKIYSYFSDQSNYDKEFIGEYDSQSFDKAQHDFTTFQDLLFEEEYHLIEDDFFQNMWEYVDEKARSILPSDVLKHRFGLNEENYDYTLEQVGEMFGVTRERIRQIESKALAKARFYCSLHQYKAEDFDW